jgi:hypothetical protein
MTYGKSALETTVYRQIKTNKITLLSALYPSALEILMHSNMVLRAQQINDKGVDNYDK